jgi:phosphatidylethanolamine/phosphatidyl-N-methylethanolamine N-methyltransferase
VASERDNALLGQNRPVHPIEEPRRSGKRLVKALALDAKFHDEARFLKSWFDKPLITGAVSPSGKALARMMARYVDPETPGPVIELGPGTGPVTEALIARGVAEERLVLVEFNPDFCRLLKKRFPKARVIEGDAYGLGATLRDIKTPAAAVVSSLPLFTRPERQRLSLLDDAFALMGSQCPFIQFTYATVSPMPLKGGRFQAAKSPRVWLNLPPARVWIYRDKAVSYAQAAE